MHGSVRRRVDWTAHKAQPPTVLVLSPLEIRAAGRAGKGKCGGSRLCIACLPQLDKQKVVDIAVTEGTRVIVCTAGLVDRRCEGRRKERRILLGL